MLGSDKTTVRVAWHGDPRGLVGPWRFLLDLTCSFAPATKGFPCEATAADSLRALCNGKAEKGMKPPWKARERGENGGKETWTKKCNGKRCLLLPIPLLVRPLHYGLVHLENQKLFKISRHIKS